MSEWSKEPWKLIKTPPHGDLEIIDAKAVTIAFLEWVSYPGKLMEGVNGERIVQCVNALAGISNPEAIPEVIDFLGYCTKRHELLPEVPEELQRFAKELLEKLSINPLE